MISARLRLYALSATLLGATCALGCFAVRGGPTPPSHPVMPPTSSAPAAQAADAHPVYLAQTADEAKQYVGDAVCASCHPTEAQQHGRTGHARSLRPVTLAADGRFFRSARPVRDPKTETTYHTAVVGGECVLVNDAEGDKERLRAQFAVGSGRNGITYLGRDRDRQWFILRLSYYTRLHGWDFTPGQEPDISSFADPKGQALEPKQVSGCLSCHAVSLQTTADGPDVRHSRFGVGCESCHGPGKAHVDSMGQASAKTSRPFVPMEDLKQAGASRIMQICGGCHSALVDSHLGMTKTGESVSRFAATALAQSKCFQSSGALSCLNCHDPHTEVSTNIASYEAACLRCHSSPPTAVQQAAASAAAPRVCKVNPRSGCIGCHMPTQNNASFPHTLFHNHWIKVWRDDRAAKS